MIRTAASSGSPDDAAAVALRGASLAFQKRPSLASPSSSSSPASSSLLSSPPSPPLLLSHQIKGRDNDARTAALTVGAGKKSRSPSRVTLEPRSPASSSNASSPVIGSGSFNPHSGFVVSRLQQLYPPPVKVDPKSASFIAATLAASRSASPSPKNATVHRKTSLGAMSALSAGDSAVDAAPIAPTGSLISLFDKTRPDPDARKRSTPDDESVVHDAQEAQHLAVHRFMAAPPRSLPKPPRPPTPPAPIVHQQKPAVTKPTVAKPSVAVPRRPPTPPHIGSHEGSLLTRQPSSIEQSPRSVTKPKPQPKPKVPITRTTQPASSPASRPPKTQASRSPPNAPAKAKVTTPEKPVIRRLPKPTPPTPETPAVARPMTPPSIIRSTPEVLSPKPVRIARPMLTPTNAGASPKANAPILVPRSPSLPSPDPQKRSPETKKQRKPAPTPPKPRVSQRLVPGQRSDRDKSANQDEAHGRPKSASGAQGNTAPAIRRALPSATSQTMSQPPPLPRRRKSLVGAPPSPPLDLGRRHPAAVSTSNLGLDSLTNAIMAGSLASSRLTPQNTGASVSPPLSIPPLSTMPKRQKSPHMLQTLRQPHTRAADDGEDRSKGHRKLRGGKHKHHEGSRKRWREAMTPTERKRYEAVWASNRGWLLAKGRNFPGPDGDNSECVANVVVRELWKRSRLPEDELAEVWDLVDRGKRGMLSRPEFVVGMWLIDQRLRGRKLPHKVSDSLWGSANGVTVMKPRVK